MERQPTFPQALTDLAIVARGRLKDHVHFIPYPSAAFAARGGQSPFVKPLGGAFEFLLVSRPDAIPDGFWDLASDMPGGQPIEVPGHWQLQGYGDPQYTNIIYPFPVDPPHVPSDNPTGCFRRRFWWTAPPGTTRVHLRFEGVDSAYQVWLNNVPVGYSEGSRLPAEFDVTEAIRADANVLQVAVAQWSKGSYLEDQDQWWLSGIFRAVSLVARPSTYIEDVHIRADYGDDAGRLAVTIHAGGDRPATARLAMSLVDAAGTVVWSDARPLEDTVAMFRAQLQDVLPWTAETPVCYDLTVEIRDGGAPVEAVRQTVGFRTIRIENGLLTVNGVPITFRGVNRHEFDPDRGRAVSPDAMERDVRLMKQHNINAVRTSHYPNDPVFLELADRYGLYLIDEADLETHGVELVGEPNMLSDDPAWEALYLDRLERMVARDRNHPAVILWSLGNESGFGCNHVAMAERARGLDPSRLIHYEGDWDGQVVDVLSRMYLPLDRLREAGEKEDPRPFILCEYAHAMGNGPGGLEDYWSLMESLPRLQGGFVWEWKDHGLRKAGFPPDTFFYGSDFGHEPNDAEFVVDGLLFPDGTPSPGLDALKKALEPVRVETSDWARGEVVLRNRFNFRTLFGLRLEVTLFEDGELLGSEVLTLPEITPGKSCPVQIPIMNALERLGGPRWVHLSVRDPHPTVWGAAGHELAWADVVDSRRPPDLPATLPPTASVPLRCRRTDRRLTVEAGESQFLFDTAAGELVSWTHAGVPVVLAGPRLTVWRAPIDNDVKLEPMWREFGLHRMTRTVREVVVRQEPFAQLAVVERLAPAGLRWGLHVSLRYQVEERGRLVIDGAVEPEGNGPETLPRLGLSWTLAPGFTVARWFGLGPGETYADSRAQGRLGIFASTVDDLYVPYVRPQAHGNHTETRWLSVSRSEGPALYATAGTLFDWTFSRYSASALEQARHRHELTPDDVGHLCLDVGQHGLGSGSCGPDTEPPYRFYNVPRRFHFELALG